MTTETKQKTSEQNLGLVEPPTHQCPDIDKLIKIIRSVVKTSNSTKGMDVDDFISAMDDIDRELWDFESDLEKIRSACEALREWGQAWKDLCKNVADETNVDLQDFA
jgi:flagellin-specific chaperone FliS